MEAPFLLSQAQIDRISHHFPRPHSKPRVDDRRVISGICYVIRNGPQWRDAPAGYGPRKTLYNRFVRWSRKGVFHHIFNELAQSHSPEQLQIDATHLKAHRTSASLLKKGQLPARLAAPEAG